METKREAIDKGCRVEVELVEAGGETERRSFSLVPTEQADFKSGLLDENAPLGRALKGHFAGQTVPYRLGGLRQVRILSVQRLEGEVSGEAAEKRRAEVKKAEAQSELTSQMIFASARGSKWGDYEVDIEKVMKEDEEQESEDSK